MKKMTYFVMALAMALGFTQCKKEQIASTENEGEKVTITLKLNNGSRGHIEPGENTAAVVYDDGDVIMVGFNGAYVGDLTTTDGSTFSGNVNISGEPTDGKIHFYYLDGKSQTVNNGQCTIDISDQTSGLPVISYACVDYRSDNNYSDVKMRNKCALVKFNLANGTTDAVAVGGMMTKATIDFADPGVVTPSTAGEITLHTGASNTEKWAILLSQGAVANASVAIGNSYLGYMVGVPAIEDNDFAPNINTIDNSVTGNVVILNRLTEDYMAQNGQVLTSKLANNVKISIADDATVTLDGVNITNLGDNCDWAGINCPGDATIILKDGSTNTVCAGRDGVGDSNYPGIWIALNKKLTIKGDGQLTAYSNDPDSYGAGIGGGYEISCGSIEIQGGVITATGGYMAAGIGSGSDANCGAITISGGTVTATGGDGAAGIGSGYYASCGAITISGDTVTATGGYDAAGIGSGYYASCGAIAITTGVTQVTATKGEDAPNSIGAGVGEGGTCGTVTIGGVETGFITQSPYTYVP
ncbi:MAG: hypothetical protein IKH61_00815 [Bacteroidales bacterium]|nr:hypothetical protein [Bacteroidales bacterium]